MTTSDGVPSLIAHPVLTGHREVAALWLPDEWYDEATRRRLVIAAWRPGSSLARFDGGDLLRFATPVVEHCAALPGWALQRVSGTLCSADVAPQQLAGRAHADVLLAVAAEWRALNLADAQPLDPAPWLDVSIGLVEMADCRLPPAERIVVDPPARDVREVLGTSVPAAATAETRSLLEALATRRSRAAATAGRDDPRGPAHPGFGLDLRGGAAKVATAVAVVVLVLSLVSLLVAPPAGRGVSPGVLAALGFLVFRFLMRSGGAAQGVRPDGAAKRPQAGAPAGGTGAGALARARRALRALPARATAKVVPQRWRRWAARLAMTSGLGRLLGAQHSAYMQRMLKLFDEGKLDDALRHAIPLGGGDPSLGQAFGRLTPRGQLQLRGQRGATSSIGLGDDLERHLRTLYRRTFEQLDRAGRVDEAVFVLAELLNVRQEALDYLEKHARFAQAAELALGWDMPAAQIVRLHALAGNWRVAALVARRDNAFEPAIALLDKRWPDAAIQLRREWAESLVSRGQWLAAVHVVWRIESERARAAEWLQVAEAGGGALAARALALRAQCLPETLATREDAIEALREDPARVHERAALANELLQLQKPIETASRRLAATMAGAWMADLSDESAPRTLDRETVSALVTLAADPALSADLPPSGWPARAATPLDGSSGAVGWFAPDAGLHAIVDAVPLPDGEFLVALGEAGAVCIDARGGWRVRFAVPAHQLVIANDGRSALALARRERVWRVSRLDLARGRTEDLGMHEFHAFAPRFDGIGWTVAVDRRVQVLDTTRGLREAIWQVADLPGPAVALDVSDDMETWIIRADEAVDQWRYALPSRQLRARDSVPPVDPHTVARTLVNGIGLVEFSVDAPHDDVAIARVLAGSKPDWKPVPWYGDDALLAAAGTWLALREPLADDATEQSIALVSLHTGRAHGRWFWPRAAQVRLRECQGVWTAFDDQGRICAVSVANSGVRSLQVR